MKTRIPFIGGSYKAYSSDVNNESCVNLYAELVPGGKNVKALYKTPGTESFVYFGAEKVRGMKVKGDYLYCVHKDTFYRVSNDGTKTSKGTLNTNNGIVSMDHNGSEILIVDGTNGYIYNLTYETFFQLKQYSSSTTDGTTANKLVDSGATFQTDGVKAGMKVYNNTDSTTATITAVDSETQLTISSDIFTTGENYTVGDSNFPNGATHSIFIGGYFLTDSTTTGQWRYSDLYEGVSWPVLNYATAESDPDDLVRIFKSNGQILFFGEKTLEPWYITGAANLPFSKIGGATSQWGLAAKWSVSKFGNSVAFLAKEEGGIKVAILEGYSPRPISTTALETTFSEYERDYGVSDAIAYSYSESGHTFYVINFPSADKTWCYDLQSGLWHERKSNDGRHLSEHHAHFVKEHIISDYSDGRLYKMRNNIYTDNGAMIKWERRSQPSHADDNLIICGSLQVQFEHGVGLTDGSDPLVSLRYSDDGGHTWSNKKERSIGKTGKYKTRAKWPRLGSYYNRIWEMSGSCPVKTVIIGATMEAEVAA